jgi:hypothetical protein
MEDKKIEPEEKSERVYFDRNATSEAIAEAIGRSQDLWALRFPERAHRLYPEVFNADGTRVHPRGGDRAAVVLERDILKRETGRRKKINHKGHEVTQTL